MLVEIAKVVGGGARQSKTGKEMIWAVNDRNEVAKVIKIFEVYPLLTTKKHYQLLFLKDCLKNGRTMEWYLENRGKKYEGQLGLIKARNEKYEVPAYFDKWLAGFTEAEGCFVLRTNENHGYLIGQTASSLAMSSS